VRSAQSAETAPWNLGRHMTCGVPWQRESQNSLGLEQLIKRVLGHADRSVTAIYNRYGYVKEMRAVLEQWTADLTGQVAAESLAPHRGALSLATAALTPNAA
jgi:hypothetical protein